MHIEETLHRMNRLVMHLQDGYRMFGLFFFLGEQHF